MTIDYEKLGRYYAAHEQATVLRDERGKLLATIQSEIARVTNLDRHSFAATLDITSLQATLRQLTDVEGRFVQAIAECNRYADELGRDKLWIEQA